MSKSFVRSDILRCPHAFSTRLGGVSMRAHTGGLNLAFGRGDEDSVVLQNLAILASDVGFDAESVVSMPQIHSSTVRKVGRGDAGKGYFIREGLEGCDGYITNERGVTLGIKTADCVPILFEAERDGKTVCVGAVHAGWRGTAAGIAVKCVELMKMEYGVSPSEIRAAIGPCIHKCCYQVGEDLYREVALSLGDDVAKRYITVDEGDSSRYKCDLVGINVELLIAAGLRHESIGIIDECTCCLPDKYYSHRYSHGQRGTMLSVIFIN